jgi:tetratricopeptide (TPR) repeat protein
MGLDLADTGKLDEALACEAKAVAAAERAARAEPADSEYGQLLVVAVSNLGEVQARVNRPEEALASFARAAGLGEKLVRDNPDMANYTMTLMHNYTTLGDGPQRLSRLDEALATFSRGAATGEALAARTPGVPEYELELVKSLGGLGGVQQLLGRPEARATFRRGLEITGRLAHDNPGVLDYAHYQATFEESLGWVRHGLGQEEEAAHFTRALALRERLVKDKPDVLVYADNLARLLASVPSPQLRDAARAVALARPTVARTPDDPEFQCTLGVALYRNGDPRGAVDALSRAPARTAMAVTPLITPARKKRTPARSAPAHGKDGNVSLALGKAAGFCAHCCAKRAHPPLRPRVREKLPRTVVSPCEIREK